MPALDYVLQTYKRLWEIWEADTAEGGWASLIKPGNRIRFDTKDPQPQKRARAAGDFWEFELSLGGFVDDFDLTSMTFCGAPEVLDQVFTAKVTTKSSDLSQFAIIALQTVSLIRKQPRGLGKAFIDNVLRITAIEPRQLQLPEWQGESRWQGSIRIPIRLKFNP